MEFVALTTIAEVGVALAGFATLAGAIKSNAFDSDSIFDVVVNSLLAMLFSLLALRFGSNSDGLRAIAAALAVASAIAVARTVKIIIAGYRDENAVFQIPTIVIGWGAFLCMLFVPPIAALVAGDLFPSKAAVLYESALLSHLLAASLLLLDVVRRNFALPGDPPAT